MFFYNRIAGQRCFLEKGKHIMEIIKTKLGEVRFKEKVYLPNGLTQTKTFLRKTDALKWKQDIESLKRRDPLSLVKTDAVMTIASLFREWMSAKIYAKKDERTVYQYERFFKSHLEVKYGEMLITQFTSRDCDKLVSAMIGRGMKEVSVNNALIFIKQIFKYAFDEGLLRVNPLIKVKPIHEPQRDFKYLHKEEVIALLRANRFHSIYPVLVFALNTGARLGEILGLCWDCVNFETNQVLIKRTLSRKSLKEKTKTKLIRVIPMNDAVVSVIKDLMRNQKSPKFVFSDSEGKPLKVDHYSGREFKAALARAELSKIRFHDLRHSYASNFMMNGGNLYDLQKILGHTKSDTTNIYAHLSPQHLSSAVKVVNFSCDEVKTESSPYLALAGERS